VRCFWTLPPVDCAWIRPTFLRSQSLKDSIGSFSPPIGQQRRVQTFATKKSTEAASCCSSDRKTYFDLILGIFP
jgi:hypothetical protein